MTDTKREQYLFIFRNLIFYLFQAFSTNSLLFGGLGFFSSESSSVGLGESSEGQSLHLSSSDVEFLSDDSGGGVDTVNGDVFSIEAVLKVGVDGVNLTLSFILLGGSVFLDFSDSLLESKVNSLGISLLLGRDGLDGDGVRLSKT